MPHADDLPPLVPGYLLGSSLGRGAGGSVWRATPIGGGPVRAVKILRTGTLTAGSADRELEVLTAVRHPHVVRLHGSVPLDDGSTALVLDLVDGGTLGSVVAERGHLSPGEVVTVLAPLAQALADLHADGIQHGDLAPGNVLLDLTGRPVLGDLGTSRLTGEPRDEVFGTAGYVDPVVLTGGPASPASDVYGLGALGWLALTGAPPPSPAQRPTLTDLAPAAPIALVEAVESAVDPDPARRPEPADLARQLLLSCRASPVWARGEGPHMGGLTHRIRALAAAEPDADPGRRHRAGRRRRLTRGREGGSASTPSRGRSRRVAVVVVAIGVVAAAAGSAPLARLLLPGGRSEPVSAASGATAAAAGAPTTGDAVPAPTAATPIAAIPVAPTVIPATPVASPPVASTPVAATSRAPTQITPTSVAATSADSAQAPTPVAVAADAPTASTVAPPGATAAGSRPVISSPTVAGRSSTPTRPDVGEVQRLVDELSRQRAAAFAAPAAGVSGVTVPGSPASEADEAALAALRRGGLAYRGLALAMAVTSVRTQGEQLRVAATATASAYAVVDRSGRVVGRVEASADQAVQLVLARVGGSWRVQQVST